MHADPNQERNDTLIPEYWQLGEDLQDAIQAAGYSADEVDPLAVDVHDLLQAADVMREAIEARLEAAKADPEALRSLIADLRFEFEHVRWHAQSALNYLDAATDALA